ncbi:MAG: elongation factor 1-alpha C-terminal domain-related protein, partial [Billgrantia desiderata]
RNMATGASTANLAIILIDARYGVQTQTRRHSFIADLLGIKHLVIAVNKMDLVGFSQARFDEIVADYRRFAEQLSVKDLRFVPMSALEGDNVVNRSDRTPWYQVAGEQGPALLELLESVEVSRDRNLTDLRFPVQYVNRPNLDFRGYAGTLEAGVLRPGQVIKALPSGKTSRVERVVTFDGDLEAAWPGQAVTVTLEDEIDISRGDWIVAEDAEVTLTNAFDADIVWMHEQPLTPGRQYDIRLAGRSVAGRVETIHHQWDVNTLERHPADRLELNAIARCRVELTAEVPLDTYDQSPGTGSFIVIDRLSNITVGAGMVRNTAEAAGGSGHQVDWAAFELELNALVRRHFPHWEAKDVRDLLK